MVDNQENQAVPPANAQATTQKKNDEIEELTTLHERVIAAMSYISFLAIIPFYFKKESKFCRFHGKQGLLIAIIFFLMRPLMVIDFLFDLIVIFEIAIFGYMGMSALSGKWKKCPFIYNKACAFEDQLSLKTKEEQTNEIAIDPNQAKPDE